MQGVEGSSADIVEEVEALSTEESSTPGSEPQYLDRSEWSVMDRLASHRVSTAPSHSSRPQIHPTQPVESEPQTEVLSEAPRTTTKRDKILARAREVSKSPLPEHLIPGSGVKMPPSEREKVESAPQSFLNSFVETFKDGSGPNTSAQVDQAHTTVGEGEGNAKPMTPEDETKEKETQIEGSETLRKRLFKFVGWGS